MKKIIILISTFLISIGIITAQTNTTASQVGVEIKLSADKARAGEIIKIAIILNINDGWHINSHKPTFDYLIGTLFELEPKEGFILADIHYPNGKSESFSFAEQPIDVYDGTVIIYASLKISEKIKSGFDTLNASVTFQACNNNICLAPSIAQVLIPVEIAKNNEQIVLQNQDLFKNYVLNLKSDNNNFASMFDEKGMLLTFAAIFLIGLALNLTPCVYPMLSVTVSLFGSQTETKILKVFLKAVVYVLGIASMYSILGVSAALGGGLFGSWLQSPWVLGGIAALLFGLALSSFGLYQIQMPYWLTSKLGGTTGSGLIAIYFSGLVVGIFAAPCVGPPVIALLTLVAAKGSVAFGFWTFFLLALGLGFPYLILGTFSGLIKKIPRSGSWLVWVEHIFGVILTGAALFYLSLAVAPKLAVYVIPITLIIGGIYLGFIDGSGKEKKALKRIQIIFGSIVIILGAIFLNNLRDTGMSWEKYSKENIENAISSNTPIIMDFYADWCIPCIELDRNTWTDKKVIEALDNFKRIKVDLTHFDSPESEALRRNFNISGVPTIIFLDGKGNEISDMRIVGYISPKEFLEKLNLAFPRI